MSRGNGGEDRQENRRIHEKSVRNSHGLRLVVALLLAISLILVGFRGVWRKKNFSRVEQPKVRYDAERPWIGGGEDELLGERLAYHVQRLRHIEALLDRNQKNFSS